MAKDDVLELLPGVIEALTASVASGHSFDHAVYELTQSVDHALSRAFAVYLQEIKAGSTRREALRQLAGGFDVPELSEFVEALIESDEKKISLLKTLQRSSARLHGEQ